MSFVHSTRGETQPITGSASGEGLRETASGDDRGSEPRRCGVARRERVAIGGRLLAFLDLTKPRISALVLVVVAVSGWVARWGAPDLTVLFTPSSEPRSWPPAPARSTNGSSAIETRGCSALGAARYRRAA